MASRSLVGLDVGRVWGA